MSKESRLSKIEKKVEKEHLVDLDLFADMYITSQRMFLTVPHSDPEVQKQMEELVNTPFTAEERLILRQDAILHQLKYDDTHHDFWHGLAERHGLLDMEKADFISKEARRILALRTIDGPEWKKKGEEND